MRIQTSEYCAVGHPDRMCDYIASKILDRHLERDPNSRVAVEVQFKDCFVTVSGEITSNHRFTDGEIANIVREAVKEIGYTDEYRDRFGEENTISGDGLEVTVHLSRQSNDIAQGVNRDGWGDQGIFWGMAVSDSKRGNMPKDYWFARDVANDIFESGAGGLDIKTQVTVEDGKPIECVVAVPVPDGEENTEDIIRAYLEDEKLPSGCRLILNGTGRYVKHGPVGDCGTTGRKLVVDFYGGNARIGGGSPWGKDATKADVTLNILARHKALEFLREHSLEEVHCAISCCIGRSEIRVSFFDECYNLLSSHTESDPPSHIIDSLGLKEPRFAELCRRGLFGFED